MSGTTTATREHLPAVVTPAPTLAPTPAPAPAPTIPDDPDDLAVYRAREELKRQEGGGTPAPQPPAPQPAATPTPKPQPRQGDGMVPAGLLGDARRQLRAQADEILYLKGALSAKGQPQPTPAPADGGGGPAQPTVEQLLQAEGAKILEAAKKFDQGELSLEEFKRIELEAEDTIARLRANHLLDHVRKTQPPAAQVGIADAHFLDQHLEKMTAEHPWSAELNEQEIAWLTRVARDEFRGLGKPIVAGNPADTVRLRQRVAELSDVFGPTWYPNHKVSQPQPPPNPAAPPAPPAPSQTGNPRPPAGQSRQIARLTEVAANQPPSLSTAGHADTGEAAITNDRIANMTEDEILALPRSVRDRYLYGG